MRKINHKAIIAALTGALFTAGILLNMTASAAGPTANPPGANTPDATFSSVMVSIFKIFSTGKITWGNPVDNTSQAINIYTAGFGIDGLRSAATASNKSAIVAIHEYASAPAGTGAAIYAEGNSNNGVIGKSNTGSGIYGISTAGTGGYFVGGTGGDAVYAYTDQTNHSAIAAYNKEGPVSAQSSAGFAIIGSGTHVTGIKGSTQGASKYGVLGYNSSAIAANGAGIFAEGLANSAILATSASIAPDATIKSTNTGTGPAIWGFAGTGSAGFFSNSGTTNEVTLVSNTNSIKAKGQADFQGNINNTNILIGSTLAACNAAFGFFEPATSICQLPVRINDTLRADTLSTATLYAGGIITASQGGGQTINAYDNGTTPGGMTVNACDSADLASTGGSCNTLRGNGGLTVRSETGGMTLFTNTGGLQIAKIRDANAGQLYTQFFGANPDNTTSPDVKFGVDGATGNVSTNGTVTATGNISTTAGNLIINGSTGAVGQFNGTTNVYVQTKEANYTGTPTMILGSTNGVGFVGALTAHDFQIRTGNAERVKITSAGNVGIGTTAPTQKLHVVGNILATGTITPSDARYKKDLQPINNSLSKVLKLSGYNFLWNQEKYPEMNFKKGHDIGFIAQEVEKVVPEVVNKDEKGYYSLAYSNLIPLLSEAIKELNGIVENWGHRVEALEAENASLKEQVKDLTERVERLESLIK